MRSGALSSLALRVSMVCAMPLHDFTFHLIISTLENETQLGRVLFYPEVSDLDVRGDHLRKTLWELTAEQVDRQPLLEFHRRSRPGAVDLREFVVEVEPPSRTPHWTTPVSLRFHAVTWRHGEAAAIAYVPALDIEVVARTTDELAASVDREVRVALMRAKANTSLRRLAWLARRKSVEVVPVTWGIDVRTPKQIAQQRQAAAPSRRSRRWRPTWQKRKPNRSSAWRASPSGWRKGSGALRRKACSS